MCHCNGKDILKPLTFIEYTLSLYFMILIQRQGLFLIQTFKLQTATIWEGSEGYLFLFITRGRYCYVRKYNKDKVAWK